MPSYPGLPLPASSSSSPFFAAANAQGAEDDLQAFEPSPPSRISPSTSDSMRGPVSGFQALGGHAKDFKSLDSSTIEKSVQRREQWFYEEYSDLFAGLVPECRATPTQNNQAYVHLELLGHGMSDEKKMADIKIGFASFSSWELKHQQGVDASALAKKVAQRTEADKAYGSDIRGYRMVHYTGAIETQDVKADRLVRACQPMLQTLQDFFGNDPKKARQCIQKLKALYHQLADNPDFEKFGFIGSSVLIAYDPKASLTKSVQVRLIDFAHVIVAENSQDQDESIEKSDQYGEKNRVRAGFLGGLNALIVDMELEIERMQAARVIELWKPEGNELVSSQLGSDADVLESLDERVFARVSWDLVRQSTQSFVQLKRPSQFRFDKAYKNLQEHLKASLERRGWPQKPKEAKQFLTQNFSLKAPFNADDVELIRDLSRSSEGVSWLNQAGLLSVTRMKFDLAASNYQDFMQMSLLARLEFACFAWFSSHEMSSGSKSSVDGFRNPAYLLGRALHLDPQAESSMNEDLHNVWSETFQASQGQSAQDSLAQQNRQALGVLAKALLCIQQQLQVYSSAGIYEPYTAGPFIRALSHGGRVNFILPKCDEVDSDAPDFLENLGVTVNGRPNESAGVFSRTYGTHRAYFSARRDALIERSGFSSSLKNLLPTSRFQLFGMNVAIGGFGALDWNGQKITNDGSSGHIFFGYMPPTDQLEGVLQIGLETAAPQSQNALGYTHAWSSSQAHSSILSAVGGAKFCKIGFNPSAGNHNARQVDLRSGLPQVLSNSDAITEILKSLG